MKDFKTVSLDGVSFQSPSLDISCSDGSLMFFHFGGEFEFDDFLITRASKFKHEKFVDIFDTNADIKPPIKRKLEYVVNYGTDRNEYLLEQCGIECRVMDPASLQFNRKARRVKTDRIDVERLL